MKFVGRLLVSIFYRIEQIIFRLTWASRFSNFGQGTTIRRPLNIGNPQNIFIGKGVVIQYKAWLTANPQTGSDKAELIIGDGCRIGNFNHIYSTLSIVLEENVLTADRVYISDNAHGYTDICAPIYSQPITQLNCVRIGKGAWLGENVCIIGANVGKQSVVGANSVVTKDIPDYCVAVGSPAYIIKRFNFQTQTWERTNPDGSFKATEK